MARIPVTFTVDPEEDPDVVRWLESLGRGEKSGAIRDAIRDHISRTEAQVSLGDVYRAVQRLEKKVAAGVVLKGDDQVDEWEEPDDIAAALDGLGRM